MRGVMPVIAQYGDSPHDNDCLSNLSAVAVTGEITMLTESDILRDSFACVFKLMCLSRECMHD